MSVRDWFQASGPCHSDRRRPAAARQRARLRRLRYEYLEPRYLLTVPFVTSTTPDLTGDPSLPAGTKSLKVVFSETMLGADSAGNYELRAAGADDAWDSPDDVLTPLTPAYVGRTATLAFAVLPAGRYRLTVRDAIVDDSGNHLDGNADGAAGGDFARAFSIVPGPATKLSVSGFPQTVTAGVDHPLTVRALDAYNNTATDYQGTVAFASSDPLAVLPAGGAFAAGDQGVRTFLLNLRTAGTSRSITVTDTASSMITGKQQGITVVHAAASSLAVTGYPAEVTAGQSHSFVVTLTDAFGNKALDYTGTIRFSSDDVQAALPDDYTFLETDRGDRTFSATFKTAGAQRLTATDVGTPTITGTQSGILVAPAQVKKLSVGGFPSPTVAGDEHAFTVTAVDAYENRATNYTGTIAFTSSDIFALLPADYTFTSADAGSKAFAATLRNTGSNRSITATDVADAALMGRQSGIVVGPSYARYSATSNIIYITGPVSTTLSQVKHLLPQAPLELIDAAAGTWQLNADLRLEQGATLLLHGSSYGGDVSELRLRSENTTEADAFVEVRADWGHLDIRGALVTSWDSAAGGPDTEYSTFGRAFMRARSFLDADGQTPRESRMDIIDSEIQHLGFNASESYGLSWKVNGQPGANFELYDLVEVRGDIRDSFIHDNYFGVFTYGASDMQWIGNEVAYNVVYGFDPHDDSDFLTIENNHIHHNGSHGLIASKRCDNLVIRNNLSEFNDGNGIMLHRSSDYSLVELNTSRSNLDSGIALYDSRNNVVRHNVLKQNLTGIRFSMGSADNLVEHNEIADNTGRGIAFFRGNDEPSPGDDARPKRNLIRGNTVRDNGAEGLRVRDADFNTFEDNIFLRNATELRFEFALGNVFRDNSVPNNAVLVLRGTPDVQTYVYLANQPGLRLDIDEYNSVIHLESASSGEASVAAATAPTETFALQPSLATSDDIASSPFAEAGPVGGSSGGEASLQLPSSFDASLELQHFDIVPYIDAVLATDDWR